MNKELNKILYEIFNEGIVGFSADDSDERIKARDRLESERFIAEKKKDVYKLTDKGYEVIDLGGYQIFKEKQNREILKDKKIKDLTLRQLKGNIFQIKFWWLLILINAIIAIVAANFKLILRFFGI
jgi:uncharacterized protein YwqG